MVVVKYKLVDNTIPTTPPNRAKFGDAGLDICATGMKTTGQYLEYETNLSFEIPFGYVGLLFPRSSISKYDLVLANAVGVVDAGYRGPVTFRFKRTNPGPSNVLYSVGDKIGQLVVMPIPEVQMVQVDELSSTERGDGGYGSSGV